MISPTIEQPGRPATWSSAITARPGVTVEQPDRDAFRVQAMNQIPKHDHDQFAAHFHGPDGLQLLVEVAHDFRSPLTAILFLSESIQMGQAGPVTEAQHQQLGTIYSAALGLLSWASDLIELAQGGDQLADKDRVEFSLQQIFTSVIDVARPMADEKGLAIRLATSGEDIRVGYPVALSRVLLNLATNALKFTSSGYVELQAEATAANRVRFSVTDTGAGLEPDVLQKLFDPFRTHSARKTTTLSGTGLGLTICQRLVNAMGSKLEAHSVVGEGTRFSFEIDLPAPGSSAERLGPPVQP